MPEKQSWSIILHGGAKTISAAQDSKNRKGVAMALSHGVAVLEKGGCAIDAVVAAVKTLEGDPTFNAGYGSVKRSNGEVELDAAVMDGRTMEIGSVAVLENIEHPIVAAQALLREDAVMLAGKGATNFALNAGCRFRDINDAYDEVSEDSEHDTVGCVARDNAGNIAVGISTGGLSGVIPGRIGDAPVPACGFWADNARGGLCMSGDGEKIIRAMMAAAVLHGCETKPANDAILDALKTVARFEGEAGCIFIAPDGKISWNHNSTHFAVAYQHADEAKPCVYLQKSEEAA